MGTLIIKVPKHKTALVRQLLSELGVPFEMASKSTVVPNSLTKKTIENAHKGIGLNKPIGDIRDFIRSL
jgi:hypothetical protein